MMPRSSLSFALATVLLMACSGDPDTPSDTGHAAGAAGTVIQVPVIEGPVALDSFCATFDELHCLANTGCCTSGERFASVEACQQQSQCPVAIETAKAPVTAGTLVYDASAAGDYLRSLATSVSGCGAQASAPLDLRLVLRGTLAAGGDCTPASGADELAALRCGSGLRCEVHDDDQGKQVGSCVQATPASTTKSLGNGSACEDGGDCATGRCADGVCAELAAAGQPCLGGDDCTSGQCEGDESGSGTCVSGGDLFCSAAAEETPQNDDWTSPTSLCVTAQKSSGAGTSADLSIGWVSSGKRYQCAITGGISSGKEKCCTPAYSTSTLDSTSSFGVKFDSGDGLRITQVRALKGSNEWKADSFANSSKDLKCEGCSAVLGIGCESCWIDSDGNGGCPRVTVNMSGNHYVSCDYSWSN